jgi:hypothetical protein
MQPFSISFCVLRLLPQFCRRQPIVFAPVFMVVTAPRRDMPFVC